jgi:hypothetical protein
MGSDDGRLYTRHALQRSSTARVPFSFSSSGTSFVRILGYHRQSLSNSEAFIRHTSVLSRSASEIHGSGDAPDHRIFLIQTVLRFWQMRRRNSPRLARTNSGFLSRNSLAAKGDALIHGPRLVAGPVGSEWRTRRPYQRDS